jgi:hypothetical protein
MKTHRLLLVMLVVVLLGLVVVTTVSAQGGGDRLRTQDHIQLKDGSCLQVPDPVCNNPDCDGVPDQVQDRLGPHWAE